jgi:hypothetical protein
VVPPMKPPDVLLVVVVGGRGRAAGGVDPHTTTEVAGHSRADVDVETFDFDRHIHRRWMNDIPKEEDMVEDSGYCFGDDDLGCPKALHLAVVQNRPAAMRRCRHSRRTNIGLARSLALVA